MDDVKKMLRSVINGQSAIKQELLDKISRSDKNLSDRINDLEKTTEEGFKEVNKRLDSIGTSVACLEDDAPTIEEFDKLEKRVNKIEKKLQTPTQV